MKKNISLYPIVVITMLLLLTNSCITKKKTGGEITKIVYHYGDSSVAPQYHRSYEITATPDELHIIVDSYGKILKDTVFVNTPKNFKILTDKIKDAGLKNKKNTEEEKGCTGGTTKSIEIYSEDNLKMSGLNYFCGGESFGDLKGDINAFAQEIKKMIPNIEKLLER